jgi:ferrous iron transport protein B
MHSVTKNKSRQIAIIGNPNSGKTTLFNALTGMRQKVANYPGVTVEKKEGTITFPDTSESTLLDLPGTYSLSANSPDEKIATDVLLGRMNHHEPLDMVICVVDASNLERNLYLVSQIIDYKIPVVIALNMIDIAEQRGISIDIAKLSAALGVKVIPTVASKGIGNEELLNVITHKIHASTQSRLWNLPQVVREECDELRDMLLEKHHLPEPLAFHEAMTLLTSPHAINNHQDRFDPEIIAHVKKDHQKLDFLGYDCQAIFIESRYAWIKRICDGAVSSHEHSDEQWTDRLDKILTHKVWGFVVFLGIMTIMFQSIFSWATIPMQLIGNVFNWLSVHITQLLPKGDIQDLLVNGALAGVGAVVTFLPQILFLFLFIGLLEDTGYMARAAFIMDRLMNKVGLHGKSFIPMLSSFACAIPGIMATRTIESKKDRLVTMLVAPLMSCSARLPVYTLLIAAFIPKKTVFGIFGLPGLTLVSMYLLGLVAALGMAWLFKKTLLRSDTPAFIMELPPYKLPSLKSVVLHMWERGALFLKRAGTIILGVSVVLWFLATYPRIDGATPSQQLQHSFAGRAGHLIEPLVQPLGFDWKIGIGIVTSLLQREVFVSTMGTIYNIQDTDGKGTSISLQEKLQSDTNPATGLPSFTILTAICLMVYYVLAMQCMSTVAVMKRETNGWKWPLFQFVYMNALAYTVTFLVYRIGLIIMKL